MKINDIKPKMSAQIKRGLNQAAFGATILTYNNADHTFNQSGDIYGGNDRISDIGPKLKVIKDTTP